MQENELFGERKPPPKVIIEDKRFNREEIFSEPPIEPVKEPSEEKKETSGPSEKKETPELGKEKAQRLANDKSEKGGAEPQLVSLFSLGVDGYLKQTIGVLFNFAYVYMGLLANPDTGLLTQDLAKAKLAIDTMDFIAEKMKNGFTKEEQAELQRILRDLKTNFINIASSPVGAKNQGKNRGG